MSDDLTATTDGSDDAAMRWHIERRGAEVVATNDTTGEVWESSSIYAVCMAIAAGGNDLHAPAKWLRFLSEWMTAVAEEGDHA